MLGGTVGRRGQVRIRARKRRCQWRLTANQGSWNLMTWTWSIPATDWGAKGDFKIQARVNTFPSSLQLLQRMFTDWYGAVKRRKMCFRDGIQTVIKSLNPSNERIDPELILCCLFVVSSGGLLWCSLLDWSCCCVSGAPPAYSDFSGPQWVQVYQHQLSQTFNICTHKSTKLNIYSELSQTQAQLISGIQSTPTWFSR